MDVFPLNIIQPYAKKYELPDFVKSAEVVTQDNLTKLPSQVFADPTRKLPIFSKSATWLSHLKFLADPDSINKNTKAQEVIAMRLQKAANYWGIGSECEDLAANFVKEEEAKKIPPNDNNYALVIPDKGVRKWPIAGEENVKRACEEIISSVNRLPLSVRKTAAYRILHRANQLAVNLEKRAMLEQMAGLGVAPRKAVCIHLVYRGDATRNQDLREKCAAMAMQYAQGPEYLHRDEAEKIASFMDIVDRMSGMFSQYNRGLPTPEQICHAVPFSEMQKAAEESVRLQNGQVIPLSSLARVPLKKLAAMGDDFVEAMADDGGSQIDLYKAAEILPTLPRDDADLLTKLIGKQ